ncbi:hypothetical protein [Rubrolithibacter danxiaensis]|uniref:hypothetical protein n=1 Tax=Rubrolithibacter danxiaensis TaxID=3390805 RepID=UPI003BF8BB08
MRRILLIGTIFLVTIFCSESKAQVHVDINIGQSPVYVTPVPVSRVDYYYLPDVQAYYYVPTRRYYYFDDGVWISRTSLPGRYRDCNVYRVRHVPVYESRPYLRHAYYRQKYEVRNVSYRYSNSKGNGHHGKGNGHSRGKGRH